MALFTREAAVLPIVPVGTDVGAIGCCICQVVWGCCWALVYSKVHVAHFEEIEHAAHRLQRLLIVLAVGINAVVGIAVVLVVVVNVLSEGANAVEPDKITWCSEG